MQGTLVAERGTSTITREGLRSLPVPASTGTFKPIPHHEIVDALVETLGFRHIGLLQMNLQLPRTA